MNCEICREPLKGEFIEGVLADSDQKVTMCKPCHKTYGKGTGISRGQRFKKRKGKWVPVHS